MNSWGSYNPSIASDFVKQWEGRELKAYRCSAGVWTIGYGHTEGVKEGDTISPSEADALLVEDLRKHAEALAPYVNAPVTRGQYIAMLSLAFNVGVSAVKKSSLLRFVNLRKTEDAAAEFDKWIYAGGKESDGLKARRAREKALFLGE